MRLNWVLLPREPGSASFYGVFKQAPRRTRSPGGGRFGQDGALKRRSSHFLAGFGGVEAGGVAAVA